MVQVSLYVARPACFLSLLLTRGWSDEGSGSGIGSHGQVESVWVLRSQNPARLDLLMTFYT